MLIRMNRPLAAAMMIAAGLGLSACSSEPSNRSLNSVKQPVVERANYTLDLQASSDGLAIPEQSKLVAWFDSMNLRFGDRVSIDDPTANPGVRNAVESLAGRYGLLVSDTAPVTVGFIDPGKIRVVVTRSTASVPGCPSWPERSSSNYNNGTSDGYGCAINGNLAAMIADPEHLLHGAENDGDSYVTTSNTAIETYQKNAGSTKSISRGSSTSLGEGGN